MGEKEPTEAFLSCRRRSNAVTAQAGPPVTYIHTYRQLAWRETKKDNIKDCVFAAEKIVKTSSWLFSFEQFAKCLLSKEGEALRK